MKYPVGFSLLASAFLLLPGRICKAYQAADPRPLLSFDFAASLTDAAGTGIALKLSTAAAVRQGALVFSASEGSFAEPAEDCIGLQKAASEVSAATGNQHLKAWTLELAALA